jgi:predicted nucleic acid-binding Zn ribbon protein
MKGQSSVGFTTNQQTGKNNPKWTGVKFCSVCGRELVGWKERKNKTCSLQCSLITKKHEGENHPRWSGKKYCVICGRELIGATPRKSKTCSRECASINRSKIRTGKNNPRWINGQKYCKECGKEITNNNRWNKTKSFCSRRCSADWSSKNRSRENSPLWRGGSKNYREYPREFNLKLRSSIRIRDQYKCRFCATKSKSLDVHHIDGNKKNTDPNNLISVCRSCHRKVHCGKLPIIEET